jgi:hypothetical protein
MKVLTIIFMMTEVYLSTTWANEQSFSTQEKVEMLKSLDIDRAATILSPEVTLLARELQANLKQNPHLKFTNNEKLATGLVTIVVFVAARTYGDYIRGNGLKHGNLEFQEIEDTVFDLI